MASEFSENTPLNLETNDNPTDKEQKETVDKRNSISNFRTPLKLLCDKNLDTETPQSKRKSRFSMRTPTFPSMFYNLRPTPSRLSRPLISFDSPFTEGIHFKNHYATDTIAENQPNSPVFVVQKETEPEVACAPHNVKDRKRKRKDTENFKSFSQLVADFQKTPKRYRTVPRDSVFQPVSKQTSPKRRQLTPNLGPHAKRARQVLTDNQMNVQKISESSGKHRTTNNVRCTVPEPFAFETEARAALAVRKVPQEEKYVFHAQDIPRNILERAVGVREKAPLKLTQPMSPAFALNKRSAEWKKVERTLPKEDNPSATDLKPRGNTIRRIPSASKVSQSTGKTCTSMQAFSFDARNKAMLDAKEAKLQKAREEKQQHQTVFKAHAIPGEVFSPVLLTPRPQKVTVPAPFNFRLSDRKTTKQSETVYRFNAEPTSAMKSLRKRDKSMAVRNTPTLYTERRAMEKIRKQQMQMEQELQEREMAEQQKDLEEIQRREELRKYRESLVHKPQPVRQGHMDVKPSNKKLTVPQSPNFATNSRFQLK